MINNIEVQADNNNSKYVSITNSPKEERIISPSIKLKERFDSFSEEIKLKSQRRQHTEKMTVIGWLIGLGTTLLSLGICTIFLLNRKSSSRSHFSNFLDSLKRKVEKKPETFSFKDKIIRGKNWLEYKILKPISIIGEKIDKKLAPLSNMVTMKDTLVGRACQKLHLTSVIDGIEKLFRDLSFSACNKKYNESYITFENTIAKMKSCISKDKNPELFERIEKLQSYYLTKFDKASREERIKKFDDKTKNLAKDIYKDLWQDGTFIKKGQIKSELKQGYMVFDRANKKYGIEKIRTAIKSDQDHLINDLDQICTDMKSILNKNDWDKLVKKKNKFIFKFNQAIFGEKDLLYDKLIELKLGSATTDVIGLIVPILMMVIDINLAKDDKEKRRKVLENGIPIIGGIGVTFWSAARMDSNIKSLALGLSSGWILNFIAREANTIVDKVEEKVKFNNITKEYYNGHKVNEISQCEKV